MLDKEALSRIALQRNFAMSIVTTKSAGKLAGCLVGFLTQCSLKPVHFLVCLSDKNYTWRVAQQATHIAVHFLAKDELHLAELFGGQTGDKVNKFEMCEWQEGPHELPLLTGCKRKIVGRIIAKFDVGDHSGFFIDPEYAESPEGYWDILYQGHCAHIEPGHPV